MLDYIKSELQDHKNTYDKIDDEFLNLIMQACQMVVKTLKNGNKVLICGNGGSAADAQHFAAELTGRYKTERAGLPGIALTTDTSALTAIGNDYGYEYVFSRQTEALGREGDLLIGISTSGNSQNVLNALSVAKSLKMNRLCLSGRDGGKMNENCELNLIAPAKDTARIQEVHIFIIHIICGAIDEAFN